MATTDDPGMQRWLGLAVGIGLATMLGLFTLAIYLLRRPSSGQPILLPSGGSGMSGLGMWAPEPSSQPPIMVTGGEEPLQASPTIMNTFPLPSLNDITIESVRIASATTTPYDIVLRVVGSCDGYAAFSLNPDELNRTGMLVPTGQTIILQAGQEHRMRLLPRQAVFGKGLSSQPGGVMYASVTGHEVGTRLYR